MSEELSHKPPCAYFLAHKEDYDRHRNEIEDLKLCYRKLDTIEADQKQALRTQREFKGSHQEMKTALALHSQTSSQILDKISEIGEALKGVEKRALTRESVENMMLKLSVNFASQDDLASVKEAIYKVEDGINDKVNASLNARLIKAWPVIVPNIISVLALILTAIKVLR